MSKKRKYDYLPRVRRTWKFNPTERVVPSHKQYKREDFDMSSELDDLYPTREEEEREAYEEMWNNLDYYDAWMLDDGLGIDDIDEYLHIRDEDASESELDD